jgi:hypothetical protein
VDPAEAHRVGLTVTGQAYRSPVVATSDAFQRLAADARSLLEVLDGLVDDDGREIWMTAGEVELDQWVEHVIEARDAFRRSLRGIGDSS